MFTKSNDNKKCPICRANLNKDSIDDFPINFALLTHIKEKSDEEKTKIMEIKQDLVDCQTNLLDLKENLTKKQEKTEIQLKEIQEEIDEINKIISSDEDNGKSLVKALNRSKSVLNSMKEIVDNTAVYQNFVEQHDMMKRNDFLSSLTYLQEVGIICIHIFHSLSNVFYLLAQKLIINVLNCNINDFSRYIKQFGNQELLVQCL